MTHGAWPPLDHDEDDELERWQQAERPGGDAPAHAQAGGHLLDRQAQGQAYAERW